MLILIALLPLIQYVTTAFYHAPVVTATPGFVNETNKNSTLTTALGTKTFNTCSTDSYCLMYSDATLAGNLGITAFQFSSTPTATLSTSDDKSDTYTCLSQSSTDSSKKIGVCYSPNLTSGAHSVTVGFSAAVTQVAAVASQFYNIATSSPLDTSTSCVGTSSTTANCASVTTTQAKDLIYVFVCRTGTPTSTSAFQPGSGFTLGTAQYQDGCATEYEVDSSTGSITPSMTLGGASTYIEYVLAFKAASAGTAPTGTYIQRLESWSSPQSQALGTSWKMQFPSGGTPFFGSTCGSLQITGVSDSGSNTWTSTGTINIADPTAGNSIEFYVKSPSANSTGLQTISTSSSLGSAGDCTLMFWDIVGLPSNTFVYRSKFSGINSSVLTTLATANQTFFSNTTSALVMVEGGEEENTSISFSSPSSSTYFDGANYGGMSISGPVPVDENNPWGHFYTSNTVNPAINFTMSETTGGGGAGAWLFDTNAFLTSGIGIINTANAQATATTSDIQVTVPSTTSGDLLVTTIGMYDGATSRTVSKVCTGTSTTCATGTQFTQAASAASAASSNEANTDIWYLLSAPSGITTVTVVYSGTFSGSPNQEVAYYEVMKASAGTWATDGGAHTSNGSNTTTVSGPSLTPTGTNDACFAHVGISTNITAAPASGNSWFSGPPVLFTNTSDASEALLTNLTTSQTPQFTAGSSGTFNGSTACFK